MADFELYEGRWHGESVRFRREFRGRRLDDAECALLCKGEEIEISGLVSQKTGKTYGVVAKLVEPNEHSKYVHIEQIGFASSKRGVPDEWCQHKFTEDEKLLLESGHRVELAGCVSKAGNVFDVPITYEEVDGRMRIVPHFPKRK